MEEKLRKRSEPTITRRELGEKVFHTAELGVLAAGFSLLSNFLNRHPLLSAPRTRLTIPHPLNTSAPFFLHKLLFDSANSVEMNHQYPNFCIRNDNPDYMQGIASAGIGFVRIAGPYQHIGMPATKFEQAIRMAEYAHLHPLIVFAPVEVSNPYFLQTQIRSLVTLHPNAMIELGNEPDVNVPGFNPWKKTDTDHFQSFAQFVKLAMGEAFRINPKTIIGIGALQNLSKTKELLDALNTAGVPLQRLKFIGLHAYNAMSEVQNRIRTLHTILKSYSLSTPIWMTELGIDSKHDKSLFPKLIDHAYQLGVQSVCLHEFKGITPWAINAQDIDIIKESDSIRTSR